MNRRLIRTTTLLPIFLLVAAPAGAPAMPGSGQAPHQMPGKKPQGTPSQKGSQADTIRGEVVETFDSGGYTYVRVDTGDKKVWAAGPKTKIEKGIRLVLGTSMPMRDFQSKTLDREFDLIYFVDSFQTEEGEYDKVMSVTHGPSETGQEAAAADVEPLEEGATIDAIRSDRKEYAGESVRIRGKVSKFTSQVMGKNWVHIRDGSTDKDLTVTTQDEVDVGDIVVVEGTLAVDKDFGHGYVYDVILEDSKVAAN